MDQVDVRAFAKRALSSPQHLDSVARAKAAGVFRHKRLSAHLARHAQETPDRVAIISDDDQGITYEQLFHQVQAVAEFLHHDHEVMDEQVVTIHMSNSVEFIAALLALNALGATACIVDHKVSDDEAREIMTRVNSSLRLKRAPVVSTDESVVAIAWPMTDGVTASGNRIWDATSSQFASTITFSSGSTALPKAMLHSDGTWTAAALVIAQELSISADDILFGVAPFEHGIGLLNINMTVLLGARLVVQRRWSAPRCLQRMQEHGATVMYGVPTMLHDLVAQVAERAKDGDTGTIDSLRLIHLGGSGASPHLRTRGAEVLGCAVTVCYGSMEAQTITLTHPNDPAAVRLHSEGTAVRGQELRLRASSERGGDDDQATGEIVSKGPSDFLGYLYGVDGESFDDQNWIGSGDVGRIGKHRELHFVARKKQIIIRGGLNISPNEIERCLELHPAIEGCGVVGVPSARLGEQVCVCLVAGRRRGTAEMHELNATTLSVPELRGFLSNNGVGAENAVDYVLLFDSLPTTINGKIARTELRSLAVERLRASGELLED